MARTAITPSEHFTSYQPSPLQQRHAAAAAKGAYPPVPKVCVVTGGSGCVGQRLVEMLVERGAERVVSLDIAPKPPGAWDDKRIEYVLGDLRDPAAVAEACKGAGCVWHNGAAVGPYHPEELYDAVNHIGSVNVVEACRKHGVPKIVMSSSPSTRFDGSDVDGLTEAEMPPLPQKSYLQAYAASKADGELKVRGASCDALLTCAVAPHQVYGPRDNLFLPNLLEVAGKGSLRVFGNGKNRICFSHVDNYCHGLIIAEHALKKGAACCGKFYIVTDGDTHAHKEGYCNFWETLDAAVVGCGFPSVTAKFHLPWLLMMALAYLCNAIGFVLNRKIKLNPFAVKMLTMHRWFKIDAAEKDLGYKPIVAFDEGWEETTRWFRANWLPFFNPAAGGYAGDIAKQTKAKIDVQAGLRKSVADRIDQ